MTKLKSLKILANLYKNNHKGSTYGKASTTPSPNSIQFTSASYKLVCKNRITVFSSQITLFPPYSHSIIVGNELKDPRTARNN